MWMLAFGLRNQASLYQDITTARQKLISSVKIHKYFLVKLKATFECYLAAY